VVAFGLGGLYPALLPSSLDRAFDLTIHNSSSSPLTLEIMLAVALVFVPIVLAYQAWVHVTFGYKTQGEDLDHGY